MPLWMCRWSDMRITIIEAPDEDEFLAKVGRLYGNQSTQSVSYQKLKSDFVLSLKPDPDILKAEHNCDNKIVESAKLFEDQQKLMNDDEFKDLTVFVEEEEFKCHKAVLARSDYYRKMLTSRMSEVKEGKLYLKGVSASVFRVCFGYLYTRTFEISKDDSKNFDFLVEFLQYSHMINCTELVNKSASLLSDFLRQERYRIGNVAGPNNQGLIPLFLSHLQQADELATLFDVPYLSKCCVDLIEMYPNPGLFGDHDMNLTKALCRRHNIKNEFCSLYKRVGEAAVMDKLKTFLADITESDIAASKCNPYFLFTHAALKAKKKEPFIEAMRLCFECGFPIDRTTPLPCADFDGGLAQIQLDVTVLLVAAVFLCKPLVDFFLSLKADPMQQVTNSGRNVLHMFDHLLHEAPKGKKTIYTQIRKSLFKATPHDDIEYVPYTKQKMNIDSFYIESVQNEFLAPPAERGQPIEFSIVPDCSGEPEREVMNEMRRFAQPSLHKLWCKTESNGRGTGSSSATNNDVDSDDAYVDALKEKVVTAIENDVFEAKSFDHPEGFNEEAIIQLNIDHIDEACRNMSA